MYRTNFMTYNKINLLIHFSILTDPKSSFLAIFCQRATNAMNSPLVVTNYYIATKNCKNPSFSKLFSLIISSRQSSKSPFTGGIIWRLSGELHAMQILFSNFSSQKIPSVGLVSVGVHRFWDSEKNRHLTVCTIRLYKQLYKVNGIQRAAKVYNQLKLIWTVTRS